MKQMFKRFILGACLALPALYAFSADPVAWRFKTGGHVYATPFIHEGVVYIGSVDSVFYALDAATGAERWRYKSGDQIYSTAALHEGTLCFESGNTLYGLDMQGGLLWKTRLSEAPVVERNDDWDDFHSSPKIVDGIAYIGSENGEVFGIEVATGNQVLHCQAPDDRSTVETTPAVYNGKIYVGTWNGVLHVFDRVTGERQWFYDTRLDGTYSWVNLIQWEPIIHDGKVHFAGRHTYLIALDAETGEKKWMYRDPAALWAMGGPVLYDGVFYLGSSNQSYVIAVDADNGTQKWVGGVDGRVYGRPLAAGNYVFAGTGWETNETRGSFWALDKATGEAVYKMDCGGQAHSSPVLSDGKVFFGCSSGFVYAIDPAVFTSQQSPKTGFADPSAVQLGDIPSDSGIVTVPFEFVNQGSGPDSVTLSLTMGSVLVKANAVVLSETRFALGPGETKTVTAAIDPSAVRKTRYSFLVNFSSRYNLTAASGTKTFQFRVVDPSAVESVGSGGPASFGLHPNYPNPFNPETRVTFSLAGRCAVRLEVLDAGGGRVRTLEAGTVEAGVHSVVWDGTDDRGIPAAGGIYVCRLTLTADGAPRIWARKMTLLK
ncbi:MAG: PQQ-binding-like beta-propeller repeat protein [bacterium]|nr:PQQ-binding-like beta-propeller repeat protein [bacterium]